MDQSTSKHAKIWRRTRVGGGLAGVVTALVWLAARPGGELLVLGVGSLLAALSVYECVRMGALDRGLGVGAALVAITGVVGFLLNPTSAAPHVAQGGAVAVAVAGAVFARFGAGPAVGRPHLGLPTGLVAFVALSLPGLYAVRLLWGIEGLIALLVLAKAGDIAGYYVGSAIGRTHPFPRVSPGKTTAGCVGSLVAAALIGLAFQAAGWLPPARWGLASGLVAGVVVNLSAQAGDLFESWVKRQVGIKDSGTWFGPSGGVLDLVDSFLFAVPATWLTWPWLFDAS